MLTVKHLVKQFTYRIEPKPEGGFIAHPNDPNTPALEGETREEVEQKIQARISEALAAQFPGVKLASDEVNKRTFNFHIEHTPQGGFAIHSSDPTQKVIEGKTHEEIEARLAEKLLGFVGKHCAPELSQALAAQGLRQDILSANGGSADIKVVVNRKTFTLKGQSTAATSGAAEDFQSPTQLQINAGNNTPITPESSGAWKILRFLLAALIIAVMMYVFLHHH